MQRLLHALATSTRFNHLFHFTDRRNLDGIAAHGLLSLRALRARGIVIPAPGGNEWSHDADVRLDLDRYVHLCLCDEHPMEHIATQDGRIGKSVFLKVLPAILERPGVLFSDDVSNKAGVETHPLAGIDACLDDEVIYRKTDWKNPAVMQRLLRARKFEILVPDHIGVEFLRK